MPRPERAQRWPRRSYIDTFAVTAGARAGARFHPCSGLVLSPSLSFFQSTLDDMASKCRCRLHGWAVDVALT